MRVRLQEGRVSVASADDAYVGTHAEGWGGVVGIWWAEAGAFGGGVKEKPERTVSYTLQYVPGSCNHYQTLSVS